MFYTAGFPYCPVNSTPGWSVLQSYEVDTSPQLTPFTEEKALRHPAYRKASYNPLVNSRISQEKRDNIEKIEGFEVFKSSVKVLRTFTRKNNGASGGLRSNIYKFTEQSKRNLRFKILNSAYDFVSQFCLTYHENAPADGRELKKQLNTFLQYIRDNFDVKYLWILEFQKSRECPHFHVFLTCEPTPKVRRKLALAWNRITGETAQHLKVHKHKKNFIRWEMGKGGYLTKYLEKANQKLVPEHFQSVGRFWGSSRGLVTDGLLYSKQILGDAIKRGKTIYHNVLQVRTDYRTGESYDPRDNRKYMYRCLRRYQESKVRNIRQKLGVKGRKYKSRITGITSALLLDAAHIFHQTERYLKNEYESYCPF